jgi:ribosomal-protein-alanine N-acetyltransferase
VDQCIDDARRMGAEQCFLEVRASNVAAIALYQGAGFAPIARRNHYYPPVAPDLSREDALIMRRALAPLWPPARAAR